MKKYLIGISVAMVLPAIAFASDLSSADSVIDSITGWVQRLIPLMVLLAVLFFFWGLAKFILSAGDEEAHESAKNIMIWGILAIFVMVSLWGLVGFLSSTASLTTQPNVVDAPDIGGINPTQV